MWAIQRPRRYIAAFVFLFCSLGLWFGRSQFTSTSTDLQHQPTRVKETTAHPIDTLIQRANSEWHLLLAKETFTIHNAAQAYRERRGRHPPPGFDHWYQFAKDRNAIVVEDFFDQIYHDLTPFWALPAEQIRRAAKNFEFVISVRNGTTSQKSDGGDRPWMGLWEDLVSTIARQAFLPDLDMAVNVMDESRIVATAEDIASYVKIERKERRIIPANEVSTKYTGLAALDAEPGQPVDPKFTREGEYWDLARVGCPKSSPFREAKFTNEFHGPAPMPKEYQPYTYHGFVANWTAAKDICSQPHLQSSHGTFIEPISKSTTSMLFPLFGGSKLSINNEILIPPAMYWSKNEFYTGGDHHGKDWSAKKDAIMWRGKASGGRNKPETWTRFQRHRFVALANGTAVSMAEESGSAPSFELPDSKLYPLEASQTEGIGKWLNKISDVAFYDLGCFPFPSPPASPFSCPYTEPYFKIVKQLAMKYQYAYKFLPDIDGNSFSGRYWAFLRSTSLPLKSTIYNEWHDSRLVPWLHFVPMDNTFVDFYGIINYFMGGKQCGTEGRQEKDCADGHDSEAEKIALSGREWADKVLRREDMQIYVYRLLLEYARLSDEKRNTLGFVGDLDK